MRISKEEYLRRIELLGLDKADKIPGFTSAFVPADPTVNDPVFYGGIINYWNGETWVISPDRKHKKSGCGEPWCMGPCRLCERKPEVLAKGVLGWLTEEKGWLHGLEAKAFDYLTKKEKN